MKTRLLLIARCDLEREALGAILAEAGFDIGFHDPAEEIGSLPCEELARYQLALIDARIADPLRLAVSLLSLRPDIRIAVMAESGATDMVRGAFASGVVGVVDRSVCCNTLARQLELVALGGCVVPTAFIDTLVRPDVAPQASSSAAAIKRLSAREREIVHCLSNGMSNKHIARQLDLSEPTVKVHVGSILRKLNLANRTKVAVWAACLGTALLPQPRSTHAPQNSRPHNHGRSGVDHYLPN